MLFGGGFYSGEGSFLRGGPIQGRVLFEGGSIQRRVLFEGGFYVLFQGGFYLRGFYLREGSI